MNESMPRRLVEKIMILQRPSMTSCVGIYRARICLINNESLFFNLSSPFLLGAASVALKSIGENLWLSLSYFITVDECWVLQ